MITVFCNVKCTYLPTHQTTWCHTTVHQMFSVLTYQTTWFHISAHQVCSVPLQQATCFHISAHHSVQCNSLHTRPHGVMFEHTMMCRIPTYLPTRPHGGTSQYTMMCSYILSAPNVWCTYPPDHMLQHLNTPNVWCTYLPGHIVSYLSMLLVCMKIFCGMCKRGVYGEEKRKDVGWRRR